MLSVVVYSDYKFCTGAKSDVDDCLLCYRTTHISVYISHHTIHLHVDDKAGRSRHFGFYVPEIDS